MITSRKVYERELAVGHLEHVSKGDLLLLDRGYPSYEFLFYVRSRGADFVARCSSVFSRKFNFSKSNDIIVQLKKPHRLKENNFFPVVQKFRALKIRLSTGEDEILITSLSARKLFPQNSFKELYYKRWGVETFYKTLKTRLSLENFTGQSSEAVQQDFYATLLIWQLGNGVYS